MSEQNKDVRCLNLLKTLEDQNTKIPIADQQDQDLGLGLDLDLDLGLGLGLGLDLDLGLGLGFGLTLGRSYNPPTSSLRPQPETVRKFTLNGKRHEVNHQFNDDNNSGKHQTVVVPLPPNVEAKMNMPKETKAINRVEARKRSMLGKSPVDMQRQLGKDDGEEEGCHSAKIRKVEDNFGNWDVESTAKNTDAYCRSTKTLKSIHAGETPNVGSSASYYPDDTGCSNRHTLTRCTCHAHGVNADKMPMICRGMEKPPHILESSEVAREASANHARAVAVSMGRNPDKLPMMRGSENPQNKAKIISQRPLVTAVGPTGRKLEGYLYKFGTDCVTMVCFCHNQCLSPTDFVRHAGWGSLADVENPMQHIKVIAPGF